jgi:hypothetical protein
MDRRSPRGELEEELWAVTLLTAEGTSILSRCRRHLQEITSVAQVSNYAEGEVVHRLDQPLTSICFVLRGG